MFSYNPKSLSSALLPMSVMCWIVGTRTSGRPRGHPGRVLSIVYSSMICVVCVISYVKCHDQVTRMSENSPSFIGSFVIRVNALAVLAATITYIVIGIVRNEEYNHCVTELTDIDAALASLGSSRSYKFLHAQEVLLIVLNGLFYLTSLILHPIPEMKGAFWIRFFDIYSNHVTFLNDLEFSIFNGMTAMHFQDLNSLLETMKIKHPDDYNTMMGRLIRIDAIMGDKQKLEKLREIRKIYNRLTTLAKRWTEFEGEKIVASVVVIIMTLTMQFYSIYALLSFNGMEFRGSYAHIIPNCIHILFQFTQLYLISWSTATLTDEAKRTSEIILVHLQPIAFLRLEVCDFAWQLIQNPLRLRAAGFFNLDYSLILMVLGNVVTYCVVLVQTKKV